MVERVAVPPEPSVAPPSWRPYGHRPRSELTALLQSTAVTPNGLPEAVLARLALGTAGVVSSSGEPGPDVAERLLSGELPVRTDDLPYLARALGVTEEARVRSLEARLRRAPEAASLPLAPAFRRVLTPGRPSSPGASKGDLRIRYEIGLTALLRQAGVEGRAHPAAAGGGEGAVVVPDVVGLRLAVSSEGTGELRRSRLRMGALGGGGHVALRPPRRAARPRSRGPGHRRGRRPSWPE